MVDEQNIRAVEEDLRARIQTIELLAELEVDQEQIRRLLRVVGNEWNDHGDYDAIRHLRARYPATFVTALSGAASVYYEGGELWKFIFARARVQPYQNTASAWGKLFLTCLENLRLTTFPELENEPAQRYLSRILLHAGVPLYSMGDWFDCVVAAARHVGSNEPEAIVDHLLLRASAGRLVGVDVPVRRFLTMGGDYAVDFLDRTFELYRAAQGHAEPTGTIGLPERFVERTEFLAKSTRAVSALSSPSSVTARPNLAFDPYGIGVHLVLPAVETEDRQTWRVGFDDDQQLHHVTPAGGATTNRIDLPVPPRVSTVSVSFAGQETEFRIGPPANDLLLFSAAGELLPRSGRIRTSNVWAVHPADRELRDHSQKVLVELPSVHRWDGWRAVQLQLDQSPTIGLVDGPGRYVDLTARPELQGEVLPHTTSSDGSEVYSGWPTIHVPASADDVEWTISMTRGTRSFSQTLAGGPATSIGLREVCPDWPDGTVELTVRGPLGRGLRQSFVVAEGVNLEFRPAWRTFSRKGLSASTVIVHGGGHQPRHVKLKEAETDCRVGIGLSAEPVTVLVQPPGMRSQLVRHGEAVRWAHATRTLTTEDVAADPGQLVVDYDPSLDAPELEVELPTGETVQRLDAMGPRRGNTATYNLARMTDTLARHQACALVLRGGDRRDVVARIRPAVLATFLDYDARSARLAASGLTASDVTAAVYRQLSPLTAPLVCPVLPDGLIDIAELADSGPLRVMLRIEDHWVPEPWPSFPFQGRNVFDVIRPAPTNVKDPVARWLLRGEVKDHGEDFDELVPVHPYVGRLSAELEVDDARRALRDAVQSTPAKAIRALARPGPSVADVATSAVDLELVGHTYADFTDGEVDALVRRWAPLGVMVAAPLLADEGARGGTALLLADHLGQEAIQLLDGSSDAALGRPVIDNSALIDIPAVQRDQILDQVFYTAGIVPSKLLEADAQALTGRALLETLADPNSSVNRLGQDWDKLFNECLPEIRRRAPKRLVEAVQRRYHGSGYQSVPAVALALATSMRLQARSDEKVLRTGRRRVLLRLVHEVPRLVAADLVMSELVLIGEEI